MGPCRHRQLGSMCWVVLPRRQRRGLTDYRCCYWCCLHAAGTSCPRRRRQRAGVRKGKRAWRVRDGFQKFRKSLWSRACGGAGGGRSMMLGRALSGGGRWWMGSGGRGCRMCCCPCGCVGGGSSSWCMLGRRRAGGGRRRILCWMWSLGGCVAGGS